MMASESQMRRSAALIAALMLAAGCRPEQTPEADRLREEGPVAFYAREFIQYGQNSSSVSAAVRRGTVVDRDSVAMALILLADVGNPEFTKGILPVLAQLLERDEYAVVRGRVVCPALRIVYWMRLNTTAALALSEDARAATPGEPPVPDGCYAFLPRWAATDLWGATHDPDDWGHLWTTLRGTSEISSELPEAFAPTTFADERGICIGFCRSTERLAFFDECGELNRIRMYYLVPGIKPWVDRRDPPVRALPRCVPGTPYKTYVNP